MLIFRENGAGTHILDMVTQVTARSSMVLLLTSFFTKLYAYPEYSDTCHCTQYPLCSGLVLLLTLVTTKVYSHTGYSNTYHCMQYLLCSSFVLLQNFTSVLDIVTHTTAHSTSYAIVLSYYCTHILDIVTYTNKRSTQCAVVRFYHWLQLLQHCSPIDYSVIGYIGTDLK